MVTPHAVTEVSTAEVVAARRWLSDARADIDAELIAELPASVVYRAVASRYDHGWPQFQRDQQQNRQARPAADAAPGCAPQDPQTAEATDTLELDAAASARGERIHAQAPSTRPRPQSPRTATADRGR